MRLILLNREEKVNPSIMSIQYINQIYAAQRNSWKHLHIDMMGRKLPQ